MADGFFAEHVSHPHSLFVFIFVSFILVEYCLLAIFIYNTSEEIPAKYTIQHVVPIGNFFLCIYDSQ